MFKPQNIIHPIFNSFECSIFRHNEQVHLLKLCYKIDGMPWRNTSMKNTILQSDNWSYSCVGLLIIQRTYIVENNMICNAYIKMFNIYFVEMGSSEMNEIFMFMIFGSFWRMFSSQTYSLHHVNVLYHTGLRIFAISSQNKSTHHSATTVFAWFGFMRLLASSNSNTIGEIKIESKSLETTTEKN